MKSAYDVIVVGGGTAGIVAAIQSARAGASTLLVEKTGMLCGSMTMAAVNYPGIFHAWAEQVIAGIGWELIVKCAEEGKYALPEHPDESAERYWIGSVRTDRYLLAMLADEMLLDAGADILFHVMPAKADYNDNTWTLTLCGKNGMADVSAPVVIDCTGDANIVALAGGKVIRPEEVQPATLIYFMEGYDYESLDIDAIGAAADKAIEAGNLLRHDIAWNQNNSNTQNLNWLLRGGGGNINHILDVNAFDSEGKTEAELKGRASVLRMFRFLKQQPGLEDVKIRFMAPECGIRETAIIEGRHTITREEYEAGIKYDDAVCHSFYPIDLHIKTDRGVDWHALKRGTKPTIPRASMLPKELQGMLVAGRCIDSDRMANSALRVEGSCMAIGQAAGAIAALAAKDGCDVDAVAIDAIHALLKEHGAIIP